MSSEMKKVVLSKRQRFVDLTTYRKNVKKNELAARAIPQQPPMSDEEIMSLVQFVNDDPSTAADQPTRDGEETSLFQSIFDEYQGQPNTAADMTEDNIDMTLFNDPSGQSGQFQVFGDVCFSFSLLPEVDIPQPTVTPTNSISDFHARNKKAISNPKGVNRIKQADKEMRIVWKRNAKKRLSRMVSAAIIVEWERLSQGKLRRKAIEYFDKPEPFDVCCNRMRSSGLTERTTNMEPEPESVEYWENLMRREMLEEERRKR